MQVGTIIPLLVLESDEQSVYQMGKSDYVAPIKQQTFCEP